ncbi:hypothetical protein H2200_011187 [Cladophialophora chaetospira]|uniref:Uncharacterized protein n=1 Tax=Cladophialophora chaetospira TaxID=386627 RepID=A0AA38X062_9EURO|nr:hypothetical protein H2200_011187 [Cladophialophora chaetospira]
MAGPVDPRWVPEFLTTPIRMTSTVSHRTERMIRARREVYWILTIVEYVLAQYWRTREIKNLMLAYFSSSFKVKPIHRLIKRMLWKKNFDWTILDEPRAYASCKVHPFSSGSLIRLSTDALHPDTIAWHSTNRHVTTYTTEGNFDENRDRTFEEVIEILAENLIAEPRPRRSNRAAFKSEYLSELLEECLTVTVLHELTHEHLRTQDFGTYEIVPSIRLAQTRASSRWQYQHADGIAHFISGGSCISDSLGHSGSLITDASQYSGVSDSTLLEGELLMPRWSHQIVQTAWKKLAHDPENQAIDAKRQGIRLRQGS